MNLRRLTNFFDGQLASLFLLLYLLAGGFRDLDMISVDCPLLCVTARCPVNGGDVEQHASGGVWDDESFKRCG